MKYKPMDLSRFLDDNRCVKASALDSHMERDAVLAKLDKERNK